MNNDPLQNIAEKIADKKLKFQKHLGVYCVMAAFFLILNLVTSPGELWFYWPMLGWGIGLAIQYLNAYVLNDESKRQTMIEVEKRKLEQARSYGQQSSGVPLPDYRVKPEPVKRDGYDEGDLV
jgi:2TM domain